MVIRTFAFVSWAPSAGAQPFEMPSCLQDSGLQGNVVEPCALDGPAANRSGWSPVDPLSEQCSKMAAKGDAEQTTNEPSTSSATRRESIPSIASVTSLIIDMENSMGKFAYDGAGSPMSSASVSQYLD